MLAEVVWRFQFAVRVKAVGNSLPERVVGVSDAGEASIRGLDEAGTKEWFVAGWKTACAARGVRREAEERNGAEQSEQHYCLLALLGQRPSLDDDGGGT